jgi:hypothetical protein
MEDLIGRKVRGFKFEKRDNLNYHFLMEHSEGVVGKITEYCSHNDSYTVEFKHRSYNYPADQIKEHLIDEWVIGQEYEFNEYGNDWYKRKLIAVLPENYKGRYIVQKQGDENDWAYYNEIRPIENNEVHQKIANLEKELAELKQLIK